MEILKDPIVDYGIETYKNLHFLFTIMGSK